MFKILAIGEPTTRRDLKIGETYLLESPGFYSKGHIVPVVYMAAEPTHRGSFGYRVWDMFGLGEVSDRDIISPKPVTPVLVAEV